MTATKYNPFLPVCWKLAHGKSLELGAKSRIMGILNVTPDSFSDGGRFVDLDKAIDHAAKLIAAGAHLVDVGGESTRPGAVAVMELQEQERVLPVIEALKQRFDVIISIDTYRSQTARLSLELGAHLVNDVTGCLGDPDMAATVAELGAGLCIMHNSRNRKINTDVIRDQLEYFSRSLVITQDAGISRSNIVLDPGFGFGKNEVHCLDLMNKLERLLETEFPLLVGTSRKRFTGAVLGDDDTMANRDIVTAATNVIARMAGCAVFRVHDVAVSKHALRLADAVINRRNAE